MSVSLPASPGPAHGASHGLLAAKSHLPLPESCLSRVLTAKSPHGVPASSPENGDGSQRLPLLVFLLVDKGLHKGPEEALSWQPGLTVPSLQLRGNQGLKQAQGTAPPPDEHEGGPGATEPQARDGRDTSAALN